MIKFSMNFSIIIAWIFIKMSISLNFFTKLMIFHSLKSLMMRKLAKKLFWGSTSGSALLNPTKNMTIGNAESNVRQEWILFILLSNSMKIKNFIWSFSLFSITCTKTSIIRNSSTMIRRTKEKPWGCWGSPTQ